MTGVSIGQSRKLKSVCSLYQLKQIIDAPTRITKLSALVNNPDGIYSHGALEIGISDHNLIYVVKKLAHVKGQRISKEVRNFENFNERLFLEQLSSILWEYADNFNDPNDSWVIWKSLFLLQVLDRHALILRKNIKTKRLLWINT